MLKCERGCGQCCHVEGTNKVLLATVDEALNIARVTGTGIDKSVGRNVSNIRIDIARASPCPFLHENICGIYDHRPEVCRLYDCDRNDPWEKTNDSLRKLNDLVNRVGSTPVADLRNWFPEPIEDVLSRHSRIAFQFSGGKDSMALLLKMRAYWDRMTVYHLDTGDAHPETMALVEMVNEQMTPVRIIESDVFLTKQLAGIPCDVVPWAHTKIAHATNVGRFPMMQDRISCCFATIMWPMHQQMCKDGITLIIRGQKNRDVMRGDLQSGDCADGFEFLFPFSDMTDDQCFDTLKEHGVTIPSYYSSGLTHSGDCLGCTAWTNEEDRAQYLRKFFPDRYRVYCAEMTHIADAVEEASRGLQVNSAVCRGL